MLTLLLLLACGGDDPAPAPSSADDNASLADVLAGMQEGPPEPKAPEEGEPPREPTGLTEVTPEPEAPPPPSNADCEAARSKREALEKRVAQQQESGVARAEQTLNNAQAEMNRCIGDMECAMDGKRIQEVQGRVSSAQGAYDRALEQVGVLSAGFYDIDKEIRAACGR